MRTSDLKVRVSSTAPAEVVHAVPAALHVSNTIEVWSRCIQGTVEVQQLDLADLSNIRSLAGRLQSVANIDVLILNAGVAWGPLRYTKDNFEMQVGTNHFGHFALVLPKLQQQVSLSCDT